MSTDKEFVDRVIAVVGMSPAAALEAWEQVIEQVEDGYPTFGLDEYWHDVSARDRVERMLADPVSASARQMGWVRERAAELDARMRLSLTAAPVVRVEMPWWHSHMPLVGGEALTRDLADRGVEIDHPSR